MTITARLNYSSEHPADPPDWLDYVAFSECVGFLFLTLALVVSTLAFSLQKRTDILLKGPLPLLMMYLGASLHISATGISYLPLDFLQHIAVGACVLLDY
ncbi:MAG TPA: hypothetical protein PKX17_07065, partial [Candidatus Methanomethylicus sp.]|nr:hypothetical protein [Candidatus Methanomethylicus sp.]